MGVNRIMEERICKHCKKLRVFLQVGHDIWECNGCGKHYGENFWRDKK